MKKLVKGMQKDSERVDQHEGNVAHAKAFAEKNSEAE